MLTLNSDLLRTFVAIADAGSITGGAKLIRRSQSAVSLQLKNLEEIVGGRLFHRHGRGITLTVAGEKLLSTGRNVIRKLDIALCELRSDQLVGKLRIGMPDDHGAQVMSRIAADFASMHPQVELEIYSGIGTGFISALERHELDLAVHEVAQPPDGSEILRADTMKWFGGPDNDIFMQDPMPIAVFDAGCWWRQAALSSLERTERSYRIVLTSQSMFGVRSAIASGIAVGMLGQSYVPDGFINVPGVDTEHETFLVLQVAQGLQGEASEAMCASIRKAFQI
jgi:DNA-binding transcriptional LysR family regulator